jgi:hypothetical protein
LYEHNLNDFKSWQIVYKGIQSAVNVSPEESFLASKNETLHIPNQSHILSHSSLPMQDVLIPEILPINAIYKPCSISS